MDHQPAQSFPPGPPLPPPGWNGKTNGFSIAALALSLFGCVSLPSIVFGVIGLRQSRRNGDRRGRFYALASLVICGLWLAAIAVAVIVNVAKGRKTRPDIKLGICGEHGGDPASIQFFERVGLNYVSCSPFRVPVARLAAAQAALKQA